MTSIALDFDGVIHRYSKGFADGTLYDIPTEGSFLAIMELMQYHTVFIFSSRPPEMIYEWLKEHMPKLRSEIIPEDQSWSWTKRGIVGITNRKLIATHYVDDRGVPFKTALARQEWQRILRLILDV